MVSEQASYTEEKEIPKQTYNFLLVYYYAYETFSEGRPYEFTGSHESGWKKFIEANSVGSFRIQYKNMLQ